MDSIRIRCPRCHGVFETTLEKELLDVQELFMKSLAYQKEFPTKCVSGLMWMCDPCVNASSPNFVKRLENHLVKKYYPLN